jgi:hypothetical protein
VSAELPDTGEQVFSMRLCPEFPCDNPALFALTSLPPRLVEPGQRTSSETRSLEDEARADTIEPAPRTSGFFLRDEEGARASSFEPPFVPAPDAFELGTSNENEEELALSDLSGFDDLELVAVGEDTLSRLDDLVDVEDDEPSRAVSELRPNDPFADELVEAYAAVAGEKGSLVRAFFVFGAVPRDREKELREAGIVDAEGRLSARYLRELESWKTLLRGEPGDLDGARGRMLDEWSAEVLSLVLGEPERQGELRRALRKAGVCAFGLVRAA